MNNEIRQRFPRRNVTTLENISNESMKKTSNNSGLIMFSTKLLKILLFLLIVIIFIICIFIPFVFRYSSWIQRTLLFMNIVNPAFFYNLSDTNQFGFKCGQSIRINSENGISLAAWHIPPQDDNCSISNNNQKLNNGKFVILYAHGNTGARSNYRRVALYKLFSNQLNTHVITFDYRGYGDSSNVPPTASGIVSDTEHVYRWLIDQNVSPKKILIWGHSLGTGVVAKFLALCPDEIYPLAGVLEAPFTSIYEEIQVHPFGKLFKFLPYYKYFFLDPILENDDLNFNTTAQLQHIRCPLMILHAEDDEIISFHLGQKLYQQAILLQPNNVPTAKFIIYPGELNYGHKNIYRDPNLMITVKTFIDNLH